MKINESFWPDKRILVTGGCGFLGTNLLQYLVLNKTFHVRAVQHEKDPQWQHPSVKYIKGDLTQRDFCQEITKNIDVVFHAAANTSGAAVIKNNPTIHVVENTLINTLLLDAAAKAGVKQFVFISSSAIYPDRPTPMKEEEGFINDPASIYFGVGWMKRYAEKLCEFYHQQFKMNVLIIRPSQLIGKYMNFRPQESHMVPSLIRRAIEQPGPLEVWGSPDSVRDYINVQDCIDILYNLLPVHGTYNIASGQPVTVDQITKLILEHTERFRNFQTKTIHYDASQPTTIHTRLVNNTKIREYLPQFPAALSTTIKHMVDTFYAQYIS